MIVRIYLPTSSHLTFHGVEKIVTPHPDYIAFTYKTREGVDERGHAVFCVRSIAGYTKSEDPK